MPEGHELGGGFIRIRPDFTGFAESVREHTHEAVREAAKDAAKLAIGAFAVGGIGEFLRETGKAAASTQAAISQVQQTARNVAHASARDQTEITDLIEKNAARTGFTVVQVAESYGRLLVQTRDVHKATEDLSRAEDIARGRRIDLAQAATVLARAEGGNYNSLTRLGITIPKVTAAQDALAEQIRRVKNEQADQAKQTSLASASGEKLTHVQRVQRVEAAQGLADELRALEVRKAQAAAIDNQASKTAVLEGVQSRFAGQAARYAQTGAGATDRFKVAIEELQATIGQHYLPALAGTINHLTTYLLELQHSESFQHAMTTGVRDAGSAFHFLGQAIEVVGPPLLQVATAAARVLDVVGPGPIIAYVASLKTARFVIGQFATGEVTAASAAERAALAANAQTAAVERLTVALEAQALAGRAAAVSGLPIGGIPARAVRAGEAAAPAVERGLASRIGIGAIGGAAGLVGLGGLSVGAAAATGGIAILAGGLYYLSTRESEAHKAGKELAATLGDVTRSAASSQSALALARDAQAGIGQGHLDRAQARLAIEQARQQLAVDRATHASRLQLAADAQQVRAAESQWRDANHRLAAALAESKVAEEETRKAAQEHAAALDTLTASLDRTISKSAETFRANAALARSQGDSRAAAQYLAQARQAEAVGAARAIAQLEAYRSSIEATNPVVARNVGYVERLIDVTGRVPPRVVTNFLLEHGQADKGFKALFANLLEFARAHPEAVATLDTSQAEAALEAYGRKALSVKAQIDAALGAVHDTPPGLSSLPDVTTAQTDAHDRRQQAAAQTRRDKAAAASASAAKKARAAEAAAAATDQAASDKAAAAASAKQAAQEAAQRRQELAAAERDLRVARAQAKAEAVHPTLAEIADQVKASVASAKSNLQSLGSSLAGTVSTIIDAMTTRATRAINEQLLAEQRAASALQLQRQLADAQRDAGRASADAPLAEQILREQLVQAQEQAAALRQQPGQSANDFALAQAQSQLAVVQAQRAIDDFPQTVADAQQKAADASRAISDDALTQQAADLQAQGDQAKTAAERRITGLTDELARGQVSVKRFNRELAAELERDGATYTAAGAASGRAFADGFRAVIQTLGHQADALVGFYGIGGGGQAGSVTSPGLVQSQGRAQRAAAQAAANQRLADARRARANAAAAGGSSTAGRALAGTNNAVASGGGSGNALAAIKAAATRHGLDWRVLAAVANSESRLDPGARGDNGDAYGLFQLNIHGSIAGQPNPSRYLDADVNAEFAARSIASLGSLGSSPSAQIASIVRRFERPKAPDPEIARSLAWYQAQFGSAYSAMTNNAGALGLSSPAAGGPFSSTSTGHKDVAKAIGTEVRRAVGDGAAIRIDNLTVHAASVSASEVVTMVLDKLQTRLRPLIAAELKKR